MQMKQLMVVVIELCSLVLFNAYIIERRAVITRSWDPRTWIDKPDTFIIPSSICSSGRSARSTQCSQMGARYKSNCKCVCNAKRSTFGFYEDEWKCFENTKVYNHGGSCSIEISGSQTNEVLKVIPMRTPSTSYSLSIPDSYDCDHTGQSYLMCNGSWGLLNSNLFHQRLSVDTFYGDLSYYTDQRSNPTINGRVIRLEFECTMGHDQMTTTHCALFKVSGTLSCPLPPTSSSSLLLSTPVMPTSSTVPSESSTAPLPSPSPSPTPRLRPVPTSTPLLPSTTPSLSPSPKPPTPTSLSLNELPYSSTETPTISGSLHTSATRTVPLSTVIPTDINSPTVRYKKTTKATDVKTAIMTSPADVEHNREKNSQPDDNSASLIAGPLACVIGLALLIAIIVVMRKRKKRDTASKSTVVAENDGYGRGVDNSLRFNDHGQQSPDEDEYSYAYTNTVPFAKTNKRNTENNINNNQGRESDSSVANLIYGKTEELHRPDFPPHHQAPIYNTLEEPDYAKLDRSMIESPAHCDGPSYDSSKEPVYAKVDKGRKKKSSDNINEPLYNVLEGPETDHEKSTLEGLNDEPPCYHVPKGTYPDGAPVYDVLEGPEAPVYGSLEEQDPHVYGALNLRKSQATFEENQGNEDTVYDSVGDVINDTGDIYQQLNQSGQRGSDVYQALTYPDKTMHLSELNESHSSA